MKKIIFLDRDGTMNVDYGYVHRVEDWQWHKGAIEALRTLQSSGYALGVITNQTAIGEKKYTAEDMHRLHDFVKNQLARQGVRLDAIAYCPHRRDAGCDCRKPGIGMAKHIEEKIGPLDYPNSWTIGDKAADMEFGKALGTRTALIRSRYWEEKDLTEQPDLIIQSLAEAAEKIVTSNQ